MLIIYRFFKPYRIFQNPTELSLIWQFIPDIAPYLVPFYGTVKSFFVQFQAIGYSWNPFYLSACTLY